MKSRLSCLLLFFAMANAVAATPVDDGVPAKQRGEMLLAVADVERF